MLKHGNRSQNDTRKGNEDGKRKIPKKAKAQPGTGISRSKRARTDLRRIPEAGNHAENAF